MAHHQQQSKSLQEQSAAEEFDKLHDMQELNCEILWGHTDESEPQVLRLGISSTLACFFPIFDVEI